MYLIHIQVVKMNLFNRSFLVQLNLPLVGQGIEMAQICDSFFDATNLSISLSLGSSWQFHPVLTWGLCILQLLSHGTTSWRYFWIIPWIIPFLLTSFLKCHWHPLTWLLQKSSPYTANKALRVEFYSYLACKLLHYLTEEQKKSLLYLLCFLSLSPCWAITDFPHCGMVYP